MLESLIVASNVSRKDSDAILKRWNTFLCTSHCPNFAHNISLVVDLLALILILMRPSSWLPVPEASDFSLQNLPYGVFSPTGRTTRRRCATVIGETVLDLSLLEEAGLFDDITVTSIFRGDTLNPFLESQPSVWRQVRNRLIDLLDDESDDMRLRANENLQKAAFHMIGDVTLHLPIKIGDYTDFYSSREHATNVGTMFRGKDNALQPNWLYLPVGYHGRSSTIQVSGHSFPRPSGQLQKNPTDATQGSVYGPSRLLDFELEMAAVVGGPSNTGPMDIDQAKERIFGFMLMNDWSARDIQKWEYVPLGPFTSKNFATTVSPWIVPAEALKPFQVPTSAGSQVNPEPHDYLKDPEYSSYDIRLTVAIQPENDDNSHIVATSNFSHLYWNPSQQLVHHSVTGCTMRAGDLLGSGTISGTEQTAFGSLLELSWKGTKEVAVGQATRKFLQDGDTVVMRGCCKSDQYGCVGFGECRATVLPAKSKLSGGSYNNTVSHRYKDVRLYGFWRSSSTWRVRSVLNYKGIPYETVAVNLTTRENQADRYKVVNTGMQVPVLECTDTETGKTFRLTQSVAIVEFLEEAFPQKSVFPAGVEQRAMCREMVEIVNSGIQPLQNSFYLERLELGSKGSIVAADEARHAIEKGLVHLQDLASKCQSKYRGPFCAGTFSPSLADFCIFPQLANGRRFNVDVVSYGRVEALTKRCISHTLFVSVAQQDDVCPTLVLAEGASKTALWYQLSKPDVQPDAIS